jgi:hypothetical protein
MYTQCVCRERCIILSSYAEYSREHDRFWRDIYRNRDVVAVVDDDDDDAQVRA